MAQAPSQGSPLALGSDTSPEQGAQGSFPWHPATTMAPGLGCCGSKLRKGLCGCCQGTRVHQRVSVQLYLEQPRHRSGLRLPWQPRTQQLCMQVAMEPDCRNGSLGWFPREPELMRAGMAPKPSSGVGAGSMAPVPCNGPVQVGMMIHPHSWPRTALECSWLCLGLAHT